MSAGDLTRSLGLEADLSRVSLAQARFLAEDRPEWMVRNLAELWWMRQRFWAEVDSLSIESCSFLGLQWRRRRQPHLDPHRPAVVVILPVEDFGGGADRLLGGPGRMLFAPCTPFADGRPRWCWVHRIASGRRHRGPAGRTPLSGRNRAWVDQALRGGGVLRPGTAIAGPDAEDCDDGGSAGHLLQIAGERYLTTAKHVVEDEATPVFWGCSAGGKPGARLGSVARALDGEPLGEYLGGVLAALPPPPGSPWPARHVYKADAALVRLEADIVCDPCLPRWLTRQRPGPLFRLDPLRPGFAPLGVKVVSVGRTRGVQFGRIIGFAVHRIDSDEDGPASADATEYLADYLIQPLGGPGEHQSWRAGALFSDSGDSGKGIWTWPDLQPIGILLGIGNPSADIGRGPEYWSAATDLGRLLSRVSTPAGPAAVSGSRARLRLRQTPTPQTQQSPMVRIDEVVPKTNPTTCVAVFLDEGSGILSFAPGDTVLNLLREVQVKVLAGSCQVSQDSATKARQADDRFTLPKGKPKITVAAGTMCVWLTRNPDHNGGNHPKPIKSS